MREALGAYVTDQLYTLVDVQAELEAVLPPNLAPLAGPPPPGCASTCSGRRRSSSAGLA